MWLLKARRREMHDDGRQGRSLAGTALVNESIQGKSRSSSRRQSNHPFQVMMQMALMQQNAKDCCGLSNTRTLILSILST